MGKAKQQGGLLQMAKFRASLRLHALGYSQCAIAQSCAVAPFHRAGRCATGDRQELELRAIEATE